MFKHLIEQYIGSLVRHGLTFLAGILVTKGIISGDGSGFVATNYEVIMGIVTYAIAQGFSFGEKRKEQERITEAREIAKEALKPGSQHKP